MIKIDRSSLNAEEMAQVRATSSAYLRYEEKLLNHPEEQLQKRLLAWLDAAALTIARKATPQEISAQWSQVSDKIIQDIFYQSFQSQKVAIFALGKLGAEELNLSSDIDIIIVAEDAESQEQASKDLRKFQALFQDPAFFLYRLDFNLRPGGRFSSVISSLEQFTDYFGNYGETWERMALCRLRFLAGAKTIEKEIFSFRKKFSFRRHLDYTIFDDFSILRSKIQGSLTEDKNLLNLKFSIGGIRDIELFLHSMQVAHGGRVLHLQTNKTDEVFAALLKMGLLSATQLQQLQISYWQLRELENYAQAREDAHTHSISLTDEHPAWVKNQILQLEENFRKNGDIIEKFIKVPTSVPATSSIQTEALQTLLSTELRVELLSRNKERDLNYRNIFVQDFIFHVQRLAGGSDNPQIVAEKANQNLLQFLKALKAKATFFSMFAREKKIAEMLALFFCGSDYLSTILQHRPELLDSIFLKQHSSVQKSGEGFYEDLVEKKLLTELLLGAEFLKGTPCQLIFSNLSETADEIGLSLLEQLKEEFAVTDLFLLCLGKWGGRELGFRSDLDFIFICKNEPTELTYKIARRFISRLTEPHRGGSIYDVDVRLKPSGKGGPMICQWSYLLNFLKMDAEPWERQAYLKARILESKIVTTTSFDFSEFWNALFARKLTSEELSKLDDIRQKLISKKSVKYLEGGLVDIELSAQAAMLSSSIRAQGADTNDFFEALLKDDIGNSADWTTLREIYFELRILEQRERLELDKDLEFKSQNHQKTPQSNHRLDAASLIAASTQLLLKLDPRRRSS